MIVNNRLIKQSGFGMIEVLFSVLLFSIVILSLAYYQQQLIKQHHQQNSLLKAERIAFQLLDAYPNFTSEIAVNHLLPEGWQYELSATRYAQNCQLVLITITQAGLQRTTQKRVICF